MLLDPVAIRATHYALDPNWIVQIPLNRFTNSCIKSLRWAPAKLTLSGIIASVVAGQMQYYPLDGPEGKMIVDLLRQGVSKGVEGGMPTGMPGMPQLPGAKP